MGIAILVDGMQKYFVNQAWREVSDEVVAAQVALLAKLERNPVLLYWLIDIPDVINFGETHPRILDVLKGRTNVEYNLRISDSIFSNDRADLYLRKHTNGEYGHQEAIRFLEDKGMLQHDGTLVVMGDFPCLESTVRDATEIGIRVATAPDLLLVRPGFADRYFEFVNGLRELGAYYESSEVMLRMISREAA